MLRFKIYAGNMYCGLLTVLPGLTHNFLSRSNQIICSYDAIDRVINYKHLKLVKIN